jgi:hypothetical protein
MTYSMSTNSTQFDLTVNHLFPHISNADQDEKCIIIAKVVNELAQFSNLSNVTLVQMQEMAQQRYQYLSTATKLSWTEAADSAYRLYIKGVKGQTAAEYYAFRLNEKDVEQWKQEKFGNRPT